MATEQCPFCESLADRTFLQTEEVLGVWDAFPVAPGHALLVTRRHVEHWFDATASERTALMDATLEARRRIDRLYHPDGYNIGVNVGKAGGQTVPHLHVHVIPRYAGDVPSPRGGIRSVIPWRADYGSSR